MAIFQDNRFKRTGLVKSNRYLPFPEKEWKNIKFHKGSLRIACSKWRDCEHAIIQRVPLRVPFVLSSGVISRVQVSETSGYIPPGPDLGYVQSVARLTYFFAKKY